MACKSDNALNEEGHNSKDLQLCEEPVCTNELMNAFNKSTEKDKCVQILKDLLGAVGEGVYIKPPLYVECGQNIKLGKTVFFNFCCVILDLCPVTIGDFVLFGPSVHVYSSTRPSNPAKKSERLLHGKPVEIGSDVWVGGGAIICPGVKIGEGSVIGAGSVVIADIPPYSLAVGNPCRVIRKLAKETCPTSIEITNGTGKDRMLKGELYNESDPELSEERAQCRILQKAFNDTTEEEEEKRKEIINKLLGSVGEGSWIEPPVFCTYGRYTTLGKNVHIYPKCVILDVCPVTIGNNVVLGHSVQIYGATHPLCASVRRTGLECGKPINIGSDVWVGNNSILCPGVSIGDGSVVCAGSVVTKDLPPNVFAGGNPCRIVMQE